MPEFEKASIVIDTSQVDAVGGARPEPEERPATLRLEGTPIDVSSTKFVDGKPRPDAPLGQLEAPGNVSIAGTVEDRLREQLMRCDNCSFFDVKRGRELLNEFQRSRDPAVFEFMNQIRANFMDSRDAEMMARHGGSDGVIDADHALSQMGICHALSKMLGDPNTFVDALTACPSEIPMPDGTTKKITPPFQARDPGLEARIRDSLLQAANVNPSTAKRKAKPTIAYAYQKAAATREMPPAAIVTSGIGDPLNGSGTFNQWVDFLAGGQGLDIHPGSKGSILCAVVATFSKQFTVMVGQVTSGMGVEHVALKGSSPAQVLAPLAVLTSLAIGTRDPRADIEAVKDDPKRDEVEQTAEAAILENEKRGIARGFSVLDWLIRAYLPILLERIDLSMHARILRELSPVSSRIYYDGEVRRTLQDTQAAAASRLQGLKNTAGVGEVPAMLVGPLANAEMAFATARRLYASSADANAAFFAAECAGQPWMLGFQPGAGAEILKRMLLVEFA